MTAWDDYFEAERRRIEREFVNPLFDRWVAENVAIAPIPTRAETIKHCWITARTLWPTRATAAGLIVEHDMGIIEPIHFQQMQYGDTIVIEAEGVVVERLQMKSPPSAK
jgi:hypothetical protein